MGSSRTGTPGEDGDAGEFVDSPGGIVRRSSSIVEQRNKLFREEDVVILKYILRPMAAHGSHLIYAPDEVALLVFNAAKKVDPKTVFENFKSWLWEKKATSLNAESRKGTLLFIIFVMGSCVGFVKYGAQIKCAMQNTFLGWAQYNRTLNIYMRAVSISALMCLRLLISNVVPFTSPAFAFLIAKSQPPDEEYLGTIYLLLCSMPAGALLPLLDFLMYKIMPLSTSSTNANPADGKESDENLEDNFRATNLFSNMTDYLPFSFWVRTFFMEPAYKAVDRLGDENETAAAGAALLAGHFMIWAGPATTMYSRKFVPDWWTCVLIQPIGLTEDVAIVLATWAGESVETQHSAEQGLLWFMLLMNFVRWSTRAPEEKKAVEHGLVAIFTVCTLLMRLSGLFWPFPEHDGVATTTTTTTLHSQLCLSEHSNIKIMAETSAWVTALAFAFHALAAQIANRVCSGAKDRATDLTRGLLDEAE